MPTFTHDVSEDGLSLVTTYDDPDSGINGHITLSWGTLEEAEARIEGAKLDNERRLSELAGVGRSAGAGITRKRIGPFVIGFGSSRGDYDNWAVRVGKFTLRPSGITHEHDNRFSVGVGTKRRGYSFSIERYAPVTGPIAPSKPRITRADIAVPIKNPFRAGETVIIPAGAIVWDKGMLNAQTIDRKRRVKARLSVDGHFSMEKLPPGLYRSGLIGTILAHKPYVVWGEKEFRTEVTPELLEANDKPVEYVEGEYENFSAYIESGDYELKGMGL